MAVPTLTGDNTGVQDATTAVTSLLSAFDVVRIPAGTWLVEKIDIPAGKTILTDGIATIIQQRSDVEVGTRVVSITGSNVTLGSCTIRGNIDTDTDEQNHAIFVRGASDISDIRIGDIVAENIRGDAIYVGGLSSAGVSGVTIGNVTANNVLRNAVSVTGGQHVMIGHIGGGVLGFMALCIEPNGNSQLCRCIDVRSVKSGSVGIIGQSAAGFVELVRIGFLDLDPAHRSNSDPAYSAFQGGSGVGLWLRNCRGIHVGHYRARDFEKHAVAYVWNSGEMIGDSITFDYVDWENCNNDETTYNTQMQVLNTRRLTIMDGRVVLPEGAGKKLYSASETTDVNVERVEFDGVIGAGQL